MKVAAVSSLELCVSTCRVLLGVDWWGMAGPWGTRWQSDAYPTCVENGCLSRADNLKRSRAIPANKLDGTEAADDAGGGTR